MSNQKITLNSVLASQELNLKDLFSLFWDKKKIVYVSVGIFTIIGIIAAFTSPKEYEAKCVLLSEQSASTNSSSLQALSLLAGIPTSSGGGDGVGAELYPVILTNQPFLLELGKDTIYIEEEDRKIVLKQYFKDGEKINKISAIKNKIFGIPGNIIDFFTPKPSTSGGSSPKKIKKHVADSTTGKGFSSAAEIIDLKGEDVQIINILKGRIKLVQSGKQAVLSVKMPEAKLSAEVTRAVLKKLITYFTEFKTGKQLETVRFLEQRTAEAEEKYKANQQRLAGFKDNNYGVIFQSVQSKELQLQNEFNLSFTVYNQLVTQLEQAKIQLKKESPLFTVLEPVYVPGGPSEPNESKIIFLYVGIGFTIGLMIIVFLVVKSFLSL